MGAFTPRIRQIAGDAGWALRLRMHPEGPVLHLMNRALEAIPDPVHEDAHNHATVLKDIRSLSTNNKLSYEIDFAGMAEPWTSAVVRSPELGPEAREVEMERVSDTKVIVSINLNGVELYGVVGSSEFK
jgi:hypothetical protein